MEQIEFTKNEQDNIVNPLMHIGWSNKDASDYVQSNRAFNKKMHVVDEE